MKAEQIKYYHLWALHNRFTAPSMLCVFMPIVKKKIALVEFKDAAWHIEGKEEFDVGVKIIK